MRYLFNSDFFKSQDCWYEKVKSPAELVTGVMRLTEAVNMPKYDTFSKQLRMQYMGQTLSNPPSVEGWDAGTTWIDTGALVERMNFAAEELGSVTTPGSQQLFDRVVSENSAEISPERVIDICLDHIGSLSIHQDTRSKLIEYANENGGVKLSGSQINDSGKEIISGIVKLIASTPEFQKA